jgi:hypothetical protein
MKKWLKRLNSTPFGIKPTEAKSGRPASIKPTEAKRGHPAGKTLPRLELFPLFSTNAQVGHLVFESATTAQKTSIFKTPLFWVPARFLCSAINSP